MGFGKFGFGKMSNLFSQGANTCAPQTGGHHGPFDLGQIGHHLGGGSAGHAGGHTGGHSHAGHNGGHHGGLPGGNDCADDEDSDAGSHGGGSNGGSNGGSTGGTGFPDIPADTSGITFHVDFDGDGTMDNYYPVGRASDLKTFEDYYASAKEQILADHPDVKPSDVVVKATITSRSGGETYYHFTGLEEGDGAADQDDDNDHDDACDDDRDHDGHGGGSHGYDHGHGKGRGRAHDRNHDEDRDEDEGGACGDKHANFFKALMSHGGKSFDCNSNDDDDDHADEEDDDSDDDQGFSFC